MAAIIFKKNVRGIWGERKLPQEGGVGSLSKLINTCKGLVKKLYG